MRKVLIILAIITPLVTFCQGSYENGIAWVSLEKAKLLAKEHNQKILIFFYKDNCQYCEKMKKETLSDNNVINIINRNFFPVQINSRTKDTIYYNNKAYSNQQPVKDGYTWRHDFYAEVASFQKNTKLTTPTITLFNSNFKKITVFPGNQPKELLLRRLKKYID